MNEKHPTPLERVEATGSLQALKRDPTKVVRSERFSDLQEVYGDAFECVELAALANRLYHELEATYSISVPVDIVVDTNMQGEPVIAATVDRIDGKPLDEVEPSPELAEQVEKLYTSVARYLYEKSTSHDYYLTDINNPSQYMYGRNLEAHELRIHLVDTDIYLNKGRENMYLVMEWLARHMAGVEMLYHTKFNEARKYLERFVDESNTGTDPDCEKSEERGHNIANIRAFLAGEKFGPAPERGIPAFSL